jgi:hypothetical protein
MTDFSNEALILGGAILVSDFPSGKLPIPGGTPTSVQFQGSDEGFDGDGNFTYDPSTISLVLNGGATSSVNLDLGASQAMGLDMNASGSPPTVSLASMETGGTLFISSDGNMHLSSASGVVDVQQNGSGGLAFFGSAGHVKEVVTGSKAANAALASLIAALAAYGLITDSTT